MPDGTIEIPYSDDRTDADKSRPGVSRMEFFTDTIDMEIKADSESEDGMKGMFSGYGAVFNNRDLGGDIIKPGAFKRCLRMKKAAQSYDALPAHGQPGYRQIHEL